MGKKKTKKAPMRVLDVNILGLNSCTWNNIDG